MPRLKRDEATINKRGWETQDLAAALKWETGSNPHTKQIAFLSHQLKGIKTPKNNNLLTPCLSFSLFIFHGKTNTRDHHVFLLNKLLVSQFLKHTVNVKLDVYVYRNWVSSLFAHNNLVRSVLVNLCKVKTLQSY